MGKFKIGLNDPNKIRDLLQEAYTLADEQVCQAQNEINKLSYATQLQNETIEGKAKYAKAVNDYLGMKDKAIAKKLEIAKLLSEIYKFNGNTAGMADAESMKNTSFNFDDIKKMVDESYKEEKTKVVNLNNKD